MGYSTPKPPFDLGEFLSQKATTRVYRKSALQRRPGVAAAKPGKTGDEAAPEKAPAPKTK